MHHRLMTLALGLAAGLLSSVAAAAELVPDVAYGRDGMVSFPDDLLGGSSYGYIALPAPNLVLRDGSVLFGGVTGDGSVRLLKVDPSGRADPGFGTNGRVTLPLVGAAGGSSIGLALAADGKILVAGPRPGSVVRVLRLNADGAVDLRFGAQGFADHEVLGGEGPPRAMRIAIDGLQRIRVVASCDPIKFDAPRTCAARSWRLLGDGGLDASYAETSIVGSGFGTSYPLSIAIMADDSSVVQVEEPEDVLDNLERLVRFLPDGRLDAGFAARNTGAQILAMLGTGSGIYVSRMTYRNNGGRSGEIMRLLATGEVDRNFGGTGALALTEPSSLGSSAAFVVALASDGADGLLGSGALLASTNATWGTLLTRITTADPAKADPGFARAGYAQLALPFTSWLGQSLRRVDSGRVMVAGYSSGRLDFNAPVIARLAESPGSANPGMLIFAGMDEVVAEDAGTLRVRVLRVGGTRGAASVTYETRAGTASAGDDFTPRQGRLDWPDGDATERVIDIPILLDRVIEPNETFVVALANATGATLGPQAQFPVLIENRLVAAATSAPAESGGGGGGGLDGYAIASLVAWLAVRRRWVSGARQTGAMPG